jgi:tetratricopeptide (TPR) repeat protein
MNQRDSWQAALVLNDLGGVERRLGDYAAARTHHERALAIRKAVFGERHPYVFSSRTNLGNVAWSQGDYAEAQARFEQALAVANEVFPAAHPQRALAFSNLGSLFEQQGKYEDSLRAHCQALMIFEKEQDDPSLAKLLCRLGDLLRGSDPKRAEQLLERSLDVSSKPGREGGIRACALTALGELDAATGRSHEAVSQLERALALAQLLWPAPATRSRALELARAAKTHLDAAGPTGQKAMAVVTQWLEHHP